MHDLEILRFASICHHSGLYQTIMMSLKGTLSFFLYNAPHFQRLKSNWTIESLSWRDEVHSFAILIWFTSPNEKDLTIFQEWTCLSARATYQPDDLQYSKRELLQLRPKVPCKILRKTVPGKSGNNLASKEEMQTDSDVWPKCKKMTPLIVAGALASCAH